VSHQARTYCLTKHEHIRWKKAHAVDQQVALRDHSVLIGTFFLRFTQAAGTSLGGVPCGIQDRVRERREGFFAANQRRRVCNDWPLVAASLLVLSLIVAGLGLPPATIPPSLQGKR
jgi:hypothetical protein